MKGLIQAEKTALLALVFSLPYSGLTLSFLSDRPISTLLGIIYLILFFFNIIHTKGRSVIRKDNYVPLSMFVILFFGLLTSSLIATHRFLFDYYFHFGILEVAVTFVAINYAVFNSPSLKYRILLCYIYGVSFSIILILLGVGISTGLKHEMVDSLESVTRLWFFGLNPNAFGAMAAISLVLGIYLIKNKKEYLFKTEYLLLYMCLPITAYLIILSGSGGAVLSVFVGLLIYFFFSASKEKIRFFLVSIIAIPAGLFLLANFIDAEYISNKMLAFFTEGKTTGRTELWKASLLIISDNFFLGVGSKYGIDHFFNNYNLKYATSHNAFLDVFLWGGLFSIFTYSLIFVYFFKVAAEKYKEDRNPLFLVVLFMTLLVFSKTGGGVTLKYLWILIAAAYPVSKTYKES